MTIQERNMMFLIGGVVLMIVGFFIIPPFMKKCSNKIYKSGIKSNEIDFDNMGPEIIKKTRDDEMEEDK